jgi:Zn finger protein HypA/HybF involved in hydrogenase expression
MSLALEIHKVSRRAVAGHGRGRIVSVKVAVGELSAVEPGLLARAFEALVLGGPDEGARLEIDWRPARQTCAACGDDRPRSCGTWMRLCSRCGLPLRVEGGADLDVLQVSFDADGETGGVSR